MDVTLSLQYILICLGGRRIEYISIDDDMVVLGETEEQVIQKLNFARETYE